MSLLFWIVLFCLLGGVLSVLAAAVFLVLPGGWRERLLPHFISFAIGALLGAAFLGLLPHAMAAPGTVGAPDAHDVMLAVLLGVLGFFLLEKTVLWRHCHSRDCEAHGAEGLPVGTGAQAAGTLILLGDALHNFVDGVLIAAAFLSDFHLGVVTALAVAAHEIPQEVGDFAVLLYSGFSRGRALLYNLLSSLATLGGGVLAYLALESLHGVLPYVLAVAAASFIYIAVADLIPGLHRRPEPSATLRQLLLIAAGVGVIYIVHSTIH